MGRRKRTGSNYRGKPAKEKEAPRTNSGAKSETPTEQVVRDDKSSTDSKSADATAKGTYIDHPTARSASNDPAWYSVDLPMMLDAASLPYSNPLGDPLDQYAAAGTAGQLGFDSLKERYAIPGICSLVTKMTIGHSRTKLDAANVCANAFYTHVRYVNSGRKNYDPADLMIYALAISDIIAFIMWCQRLYGYMFTYSQRNKYISRALLEANHVDADDLRMNLANFRYWLNAFINKVSAFVVPADIAIFKRRAFLFQGYYIENPEGNIKDQLYQMVPDGFNHYALDANGSGMLEYSRIDRSSTLLSVTDIMAMGDAMLNPIWGDEDFGLISGDILKAYEGNIIGLAPLAADYMVLPIHDRYVLSQFKNATIAWTADNTNAVSYTVDGNDYKSGDVNQDLHGNLICSEIVLAVSASSAVDKRRRWSGPAIAKVCSIESAQPTPEDTIEATRLMLNSELITAKYNNLPEPLAELISGDAIVQAVIYSSYKTDANGVITTDNITVNNTTEEISASGVPSASVFKQIATINKFKYAPMIYTVKEGNNTSNVTDVHLQCNVDNFTVIGYNVLKKMHECALLSLFYVPGVAKILSNS